MGGGGSLRTASLTDVCLDETVIQFPFLQALQHLHAVFETVYKHFVISVRVFLCDDRLDHTSADRIQPVDPGVRVAHGLILAGVKVDARLLQPDGQFLKGEDRIDCS